MNDANLQNQLRESLWRRELTDAERAKLRAHPEAAELEMESRLSELLAKAPAVAVPSNFTARVMDVLDREESRPARRWSWNWHALLPRVAIGTAVLLFAGLTFHHYETNAQHAALVRNVALVAGTPLPSVDALKNFDAIQRMSQPRADEELLALMQ